MQPQFIEINGLVINAQHIVSVDCTVEGQATIQLTSGNVHHFDGDAAESLKRFFRATPPPEQISPEPVAPAATRHAPPAKRRHEDHAVES